MVLANIPGLDFVQEHIYCINNILEQVHQGNPDKLIHAEINQHQQNDDGQSLQQANAERFCKTDELIHLFVSFLNPLILYPLPAGFRGKPNRGELELAQMQLYYNTFLCK
jgi:hypothetical protein